MSDLDAPSDAADAGAPRYSIPMRDITALEHPGIIHSIDNGLRTFGTNPDYGAILRASGPQSSVPLYMRYGDRTSSPIISHNAASHNILLKVTVPKRTGRKRRRGSSGPWQGDVAVAGDEAAKFDSDDTRTLQRKMRDNVGRYSVEALGTIHNTHRYRGLADYQWSTKNSEFLSSFVDLVLPGDVSKMRQFRLRPGTSAPPNVEVLPPPSFAVSSLPFIYDYNQNPFVREVAHNDGGTQLVNVTARVTSAGYVLRQSQYPAPLRPLHEPNLKNSLVRTVINELKIAMDERPVWTRRSIINRLGQSAEAKNFSAGMVRKCIPYVGYQFKGGPFRDALVKYGVDPRTDPKYRIYQTLVFKNQQIRVGEAGETWHRIRSYESAAIKLAPRDNEHDDSHIFDGTSFCDDGKVWQVCDITDPLLADLFANSEIRATFDEATAGWYHHGLWVKAKGIMRSKISAIRFGRHISDLDYAPALAVPDGTPQLSATNIFVPLPDLKLTPDELATVENRHYVRVGLSARKKSSSRYSMPIGKRSSAPTEATSDDNDGDGLSPSAQLHADMGASPSGGTAQPGVVGRIEEGDDDDESNSYDSDDASGLSDGADVEAIIGDGKGGNGENSQEDDEEDEEEEDEDDEEGAEEGDDDMDVEEDEGNDEDPEGEEFAAGYDQEGDVSSGDYDEEE